MKTGVDKEMDKIVLAKIDLTGCPVGNVLDARETDRGIDDKYFSGWQNLLTPHPYWNWASSFRVMVEDGEEVLDHDAKEKALITGDALWGDYAVEATVRQMDHRCKPNNDDEYCTVARTGVVLRQQDVRRYYILCIEGYSKVVLYRRDDDVYYPLGVSSGVFCSHRYYTLRAEVKGDTYRCFVDGELMFEAQDGTFPSGKAGIRSNTASRIKGVRITASKQGESAYISGMEKWEKELAEVRESQPKPVLWKKLAPDMGGEFACRFGDIRGTGKKDVVVFKTARDSEFGRQTILRGLTAVDLDGEVLWSRDDITGRFHYKSQTVVDLDGDGADEIVYSMGSRMMILSGRTGETIAEGGTIYEGKDRAGTQALYFCNIQGKEEGRDIVAMAGGNSIWAYDRDLRLLWRHTMDSPTYGHNISFEDLDGDGRDEVVVGYWALDADGKLLWRVEHGDDIPGGHHSDSCVSGEFDGDESNGPEAAIAGGTGGFYVISARDGRVWARHMIGHAQGLSAGNFRPDLPGLEILCGTRWDSYGILCLYSGAGEPLARWHPDNVSQGGRAVNWKGDGGELIFLNSTEGAFGLYDGYGRKVVTFADVDGFPGGDYYSFWSGHAMHADVTGDVRDEIIVVRDGVIHIYTQDTPFPKGERIYAPIQKMGQELGNSVSIPNWTINDVG